MLQFILGGSKSGKSTFITEKIRKICETKGKNVMLIVPEQFAFEAEKNLFSSLGGELFRSVKVTSFTRIASESFKLYGALAGTYANDCAKTIIMDMAIKQIGDELDIYKKSALSKSFSKTMLDTVKELKNAGVEPEELSRNAAKMEQSLLKSKLKEISLIYGVYNALLLNTYLDPLDDIMRASKLLSNENYFDDWVVFIDEFKGFTADEKFLIKIIFKKASDTYFALCLDLARANSSSVFSSVLDTYNEINRCARETLVSIKPPILLNRDDISNEIRHIEENIFSPQIKPFDKECKNVICIQCKNEYDEIAYIFSTISKLVSREGFKYNDIAIISRDLESYISELEVGFSCYNIPYFTDVTKSIINKPLIRFLQNLLNCVTKGYTAENILGMLKCEMTCFSIEEVAELENYVYIWSIKSKQWKEPFLLNPRGYSESTTDEDNEVLTRINRIRVFVNNCINSFKSAIKDANGIDFCSAVVVLLEKINAKQRTEKIIENYLLEENFEFAQEYERVWEILMELLNTLAVTIGEEKITPKRFQELFSIVSSTYDMGSLPQSLDCVIVGSADRIRTTQKRAIFILGANENVFPLTKTSTGIFTDKDRKQLIGLEINLSKPSLDKIKEERFIAYKSLTASSERLYITARKADISGTAMSPSCIFSELKKMFGDEVVLDSEDLRGEFFCCTKQTAFSHLAKTYNEDTPLTATLNELLSKDEVYQGKLLKLDKFYHKNEFVIENKENAVKLFGKDINISPTRVEGFFQCHFRYFCEQGLRAFPLRKAELNPLETGTLIHNVLYVVTKQLDLKNGYNEKAVKALIKQEFDRYIEEVMGGVSDKTKRFIYLYNRMRNSIFAIIERLHFELVQSEFYPCGFEYEISDETDITPLRLYGDNNTQIIVSGKVDRIDCYTNKKGEKYIRIIDYKSGKKEFNLNDVLYGLNLQMLIYLHCISQNGKGEYANSFPAGILYMPAGEPTPSLKRDADIDEIEQNRLQSYKTNGLLIEDAEVLQAMQTPMNGLFIPVAMKQDGSFSASSEKSLVSLTELAKINKYIDSLIIKMANELHAGKIEAQPVMPLEKGCAYCAYSGVCGIDKSYNSPEYLKLSNSEVIMKMEE